MNRREWIAGGLALLTAACGQQFTEVSAEEEEEAAKPRGERFSIFVPTPERSALRMLELARVGPNDLVLDLGSGDGRIPLLAAKHFGARGWGVEINSGLLAQSIAEAKHQGLSGRAMFEHGDVTLINPRDATVVTMYLFPALINRLRPTLLKHLRPGARIVTYEYTMSEWPADEELQTYVPEHYRGFGGNVAIRLWVVPANFSGTWSGMIDTPVKQPFELAVKQRYQHIKGSLRLNGKTHSVSTTHVRGDEIEFAFDLEHIPYSLRARLANGSLAGEARVTQGEITARHPWHAIRTGEQSRIDVPP